METYYFATFIVDFKECVLCTLRSNVSQNPKIYAEMEVSFHALLIWTLDGHELSASCIGCFTVKVGVPSLHPVCFQQEIS